MIFSILYIIWYITCCISCMYLPSETKLCENTWESTTVLLNPILVLRSRKTRLGHHWNSRTQREVKWRTCESLQQGQHSSLFTSSLIRMHHGLSLVVSQLWRGSPKQIANILRPMETLRPSRVSHFGSAASPCEYHWKKWNPRATKLGCTEGGDFAPFLHSCQDESDACAVTAVDFLDSHYLQLYSPHLQLHTKTPTFDPRYVFQLRKRNVKAPKDRLGCEDVAILRGLRPSVRSAGCLCLWETCLKKNDVWEILLKTSLTYYSDILHIKYINICRISQINDILLEVESRFRAISWKCIAVTVNVSVKHSTKFTGSFCWFSLNLFWKAQLLLDGFGRWEGQITASDCLE